MTGQPHDGDHELPSTFSSPPPPVRARSRVRRRVLWGLLGGVLIVAGCAAVHILANLQYDDALDAFEDAEVIAEEQRDELAVAADELAADADAANTVVASDSGTLMAADVRAELDESLAAVQPVTDEVAAASAERFPDPGSKPTWPWELFAERARLDEETATLEGRADDFASVNQDVTAASASVEESALAAVRAAADAAPDLEAAHVNARNPEIVALRRAAEHAAGVERLDDEAAARYTLLESAAADLLESEAAELAEKAGPLNGARVEIEAFARSLAPGVLLDFDWAPTVPGYDGPSYGGWTTWWYGDPGYSTIALSDYIAESWPAEWAKALVAHEVGHAISVKCEALYDSSDQDTIEAWATAWAISMGFTDRANGTDVYGAPSQAMIDAAAGCR
ncbi:hypothetical protein OED01_09530 [Microbacterium sp. M28]|uniref:hypothetical protein n=1 Tax=Microbacterium sp. M28 TaxID=2962064 RepID=UPI0021F4D1CB|nr:hypothetical protein [Microbacterium sp. M28]UYO95849.1 hypothetical protein OED01_09530 [Microbacterium sp. M28]